MPTADPDAIEAFAQRVYARHDELEPYRERLRDAEIDTAAFGGADAPWADSMTETWNTVLDYRIADCYSVIAEVDKTYFNLLHTAAWWFEQDGRTEADFNDTGASLAEHAAGAFVQEW